MQQGKPRCKNEYYLFCYIDLGACAPAAVETVVAEEMVIDSAEVLSPTDAPTDAPEPTIVPEPTATPLPEPVVISGTNAAELAFQGLVDLPRSPNLMAPFIFFSPDSQKIVVQTEAGVEVLTADTLAVETSYSSVIAAGFLADGRLYGKQAEQIVFIDLTSAEIEPVDFGVKFSTRLDKLVFSGDGSVLIELAGSNAVQGITLTEDGQSLMLLTNRGLERWQVVQ